MRIDRGRLAAELRVRDITQKAFASKAGMSRATVSAVLSGKACAKETAHRIAAALGVELETIIEN